MSGTQSVVGSALVVVVGLGLPLLAQRSEQRPAVPTGLILGRVVDADSGQGVSGAVVTLGASLPVANPVGELGVAVSMPAGSGRRMLTDNDGRFLFRDVPAGRHALSGTAFGYANATFGQGRPLGPGQSIDLADGEKLGDVTLRIWKLAAISGTVVDERGEPAVGVSMRCLRRVIAGGQARFANPVPATTDDRGIYRVSRLVPGDYVCGTTSNQATVPMSAAEASLLSNRTGNTSAAEAYRTLTASGGTVSSPAGFTFGDLVLRPSATLTRGLMPPPPTADSRLMMYPIQFFPASTSAGQASLITLKSGEERSGIDLQLKLVPAARVSGVVSGPGGTGPNLGLSLVPAAGLEIVSEGNAEAASSSTDGAGRFAFLGVPAGSYVLKIRMFPQNPAPGAPAGVPLPPPSAPSLWATMPVVVGDTDLTDLAVQLQTGLRVTGRVEFAGTRPAPTADQVQRMSITLQSAEGRTSSPVAVAGRASPDGTFRTSGYAGGRYVMAALTLPPGWTLRSIVSAGRDVSVEPLELGSSDINDVVVTLTDQTTTLSGMVVGPRGPDLNAEVIVFPADTTAWKQTGVVARRSRSERVTGTGAFSISGLPAGEYFVAAVPTAGASGWQDLKFLESLVSLASRVTLGDGEKKSVELRRR